MPSVTFFLSLRRAWPLVMVLGLSPSACAELHSTALGEIDAPPPNATPIELKVSDTGVNVGEATSLMGSLSGTKKGRQQANSLNTILSLFEWGPKTGNPTFSDDYADVLVEQLRQACPSLRVTGLVVVRETNKYPVVSGEIVRVKGYCLP
jgi:hypothetical protein